MGVGSQLPEPYWGKARRTGANWMLPSTVQGANSISGDSKLPQLTSLSSFVAYSLARALCLAIHL